MFKDAPEAINDQLVWCFVFNLGKLLIKKQDSVVNVPVKIAMKQLKAWETTRFYLGKLEGCDCYCIEAADKITIPEQMYFKRFFSLFGQIDEEIFTLAGRASHILDWHKKNQYCGRCGSETELKKDELALACSVCGNIIYPKISPAIIVAVIKGDEILLAQGKDFRFYSTLAGFVEPGETLEDCVRREVFEEVGIRIKNVKYFGSQPWPFPDSLMIGFTAEYESGEISVDPNEIATAGWFKRNNLPVTPTQSSIAGKLIQWFCNKG